jgi:hypothetical protein
MRMIRLASLEAMRVNHGDGDKRGGEASDRVEDQEDEVDVSPGKTPHTFASLSRRQEKDSSGRGAPWRRAPRTAAKLHAAGTTGSPRYLPWL